MAEYLKWRGWRIYTVPLIIKIVLVCWLIIPYSVLLAQKSTDQFEGYLFAKMGRIGTYSQGPDYFLQQWDGKWHSKDIPIQKKVNLWEVDPELHQFLGHMVTIIGELKESRIQYEKIKENTSTTSSEDKLKLDIKIEGHLYNDEKGVLWINKQPSPNDPPSPLSTLNITLLVQWPYRSIWRGQCPTSQLYDFFLEDPQGNVIWQWSKCIMFAQKTTAVNIPGGSPVEFPVAWHYFGDAIEAMGTYTVHSEFIATGQKVSKKFEVKFAY